MGEKGDLRFLTLQHSTQRKPAQRSRPIACLLARLGLPIVSKARVSKGLEDFLLLIPSCRVRAVAKGILKEGGWLDGCDGGSVFSTEGGRVRNVCAEYEEEEEEERKRGRRKEKLEDEVE